MKANLRNALIAVFALVITLGGFMARDQVPSAEAYRSQASRNGSPSGALSWYVGLQGHLR